MTSLTDFRLTASDFKPFGAGLALVSEGGVRRLGSGIHEPNGFSRRKNGTFVVAGLEDHTVYEIAPDGTTTALLKEIEGRLLGVVNHCWVDAHGRTVFVGSLAGTDLMTFRSPVSG